MAGSVSADPLLTGIAHRDTVAPLTILPTLSTLLVYILSVFAMIKGDVFSAFKYISKKRLFYFCMILLVILAFPSVGRVDGSVLSNRYFYNPDKCHCSGYRSGLMLFSPARIRYVILRYWERSET